MLLTCSKVTVHAAGDALGAAAAKAGACGVQGAEAVAGVEAPELATLEHKKKKKTIDD